MVILFELQQFQGVEFELNYQGRGTGGMARTTSKCRLISFKIQPSFAGNLQENYLSHQKFIEQSPQAPPVAGSVKPTNGPNFCK